MPVLSTSVRLCSSGSGATAIWWRLPVEPMYTRIQVPKEGCSLRRCTASSTRRPRVPLLVQIAIFCSDASGLSNQQPTGSTENRSNMAGAEQH
ncbi:MAG: hypothetical protein JW795_21870 [Chitinivibrionales bacterium]|nr:hypothetical protein [Chitinivibrionales bacterium]